MTGSTQSIDAFVAPTAAAQVYVGPALDLDTAVLPLMIHNRIVTAVGFDPQREDVLYFTTDHPETLRLVTDDYRELCE